MVAYWSVRFNQRGLNSVVLLTRAPFGEPRRRRNPCKKDPKIRDHTLENCPIIANAVPEGSLLYTQYHGRILRMLEDEC